MAGLSQTELARASGMSIRALRDLERERASAPQARSTELLATALRLSPDERKSFLSLARRARRRSVPDAASGVTTLHGLPSVPELFGRNAELDQLSREAETGGVVVISGPPGVGKTSLAATAVDRLASRFPDGCLAIDLRGVDDQPLTTGAALERFLTALGVQSNRIPADEYERGAMFRTLIHDRRMLVVLDNAANESQVRPLLGTGAQGLTIITCRRALAGLESARWLPLEVLVAGASVAMISSIVGATAEWNEPEAMTELVELCGNLPLAVRIIGNRLASGTRSVAAIVQQMRDERSRLDSLTVDDLQLRSAFTISFEKLPAQAQAVFRRLALIPGADFDDEFAALVCGLRVDQVGLVLDDLVEASFLTVTSVSNRLKFHDLIRIFARERLAAEEPADIRDQLRNSLYHHVLDRGVAAGKLFFADVRDVPADSPFRSLEEAHSWLVQEATTWFPVLQTAASLGWHREVLDFSWYVQRYAQSREVEHDWLAVHSAGLEAARALRSQDEVVDSLNQVGWLQSFITHDHELAFATLSSAIEIAEENGYHRGVMVANCASGLVLLNLGRVPEALERNRIAYEMSASYDFFGFRSWMAVSYGAALLAVGMLEEALAVHRSMLAELEDRVGETNPDMERKARVLLLASVGDCLSGLQRWDEAARSYQAARSAQPDDQAAVFRSEAELALTEGIAWRHAGDFVQARECLTNALELFTGPASGADRDRAKAELDLLD
ncbi:SARP family transcriptional regulator [Lentzea sp. NBRC 102530]|nr:SARP family transcriptional regulator [Lentzea sp. NBRC 102530]